MISFQYVCVIRIAHCLFAILQMIQSVRMDLVITRLDEKQDIILNTLSASGSVSGGRLVGSEGIKFEVRSGSRVYIQASFGTAPFFLTERPGQGSFSRHTSDLPARSHDLF